MCTKHAKLKVTSRRSAFRYLIGLAGITSGLFSIESSGNNIVTPTRNVVCGADGIVKTNIYAKDASPAEREALREQIWQIAGIVATSDNYKLLRFSEQRAAATVIGDQRIIYFSEKLLEELQYESTKWTALVLLAHEIGHHILLHTMSFVDNDDTALREMGADRFCGLAIGNLGGTWSQLQDAFMSFNEIGLDGYPSRMQRMGAARAGWTASQIPTEEIEVTFLFDKEYVHGLLRKTGINWVESTYVPLGDGFYSIDGNKFYVELTRDDEFVALFDPTDKMKILIPLEGGEAFTATGHFTNDYEHWATVEWKSDPRQLK